MSCRDGRGWGGWGWARATFAHFSPSSPQSDRDRSGQLQISLTPLVSVKAPLGSRGQEDRTVLPVQYFNPFKILFSFSCKFTSLPESELISTALKKSYYSRFSSRIGSYNSFPWLSCLQLPNRNFSSRVASGFWSIASVSFHAFSSFWLLHFSVVIYFNISAPQTCGRIINLLSYFFFLLQGPRNTSSVTALLLM